jgi:hypothetical protein
MLLPLSLRMCLDDNCWFCSCGSLFVMTELCDAANFLLVS